MSITSKRAAEVLGMAVTFNGCGRSTSDEMKEAVRAAIEALQEKAEREDPYPLTLEELRQMVGAPVYIKASKDAIFNSGWNVIKSIKLTGDGDVLRVIDGKLHSIIGLEMFALLNRNLFGEDYGKTWTAYKNKPKVQKVNLQELSDVAIEMGKHCVKALSAFSTTSEKLAEYGEMARLYNEVYALSSRACAESIDDAARQLAYARYSENIVTYTAVMEEAKLMLARGDDPSEVVYYFDMMVAKEYGRI